MDINTRNVLVEATVMNPKSELIPGMFASVTVNTGKPKQYLTLPQTAVVFNSYGNIIYRVKQTKPFTVAQTFVTTGETRGDQIAILSGLKEGDLVVTSGQLKLKNGAQVSIDNRVVPKNNAYPIPLDE